MAHVNWEALRAEYMTTETSLKKLAQKYDVSLSRMEVVSSTEKWVQARRAYRRQIAEKALLENETREVDRLTRLMTTTERAIGVVENALRDPQQFNRYIVKKSERYSASGTKGEAGQPAMRQWEEEQVFNKVDTKALKEMTAVLQELSAMVRDFYDIPTASEREARVLRREQLELQKQRADAGESGVDQIEVVFAAGEEAWNA